MVPKLHDEKVKELLDRIKSKYKAIYLPVRVESFALINECFPNVEKKIAKDGGNIVYGWQIWKGNLICEAEFHAVWRSNEGNLIDITPKVSKVEQILFIQDDNVIYNGSQVDNIRINCTKNVLVNDIIDIHESLFKIRNRGERKFSYEIKLGRMEAQVYKELEEININLQKYIYQGGEINTPCFCENGDKYNYSECHKKRLHSLIMLSEEF
ncbi:hypothetical protein M3589_23915 [Heyndrickxia oleronia]|mgnify:CR=1 FL=1|uniref:hypothetical protein n=1 Tax=Heyndrickxia oleronia TaxID=38875 RepID=UPI002040CC66|nr:hypothetical protein [Heyndrickxia oleronia]MCM3240706.1 hypothetical protein [Heyndrickxia oleronia]